MNLFLIGYRGSGKTTVAEQLGVLLEWPWVDADLELEKRAGKSIQQIFAESGENEFRELESAVVAELAQRNNHVIALGGGAVLREQNLAALHGRGKMIFLRAKPETLHERVLADPATSARRPNLTTAGGLEEIRELLAARTPVYERSASLTIDTDGLSPAEIARDIIAALEPDDLGPEDLSAAPPNAGASRAPGTGASGLASGDLA